MVYTLTTLVGVFIGFAVSYGMIRVTAYIASREAARAAWVRRRCRPTPALLRSTVRAATAPQSCRKLMGVVS